MTLLLIRLYGWLLRFYPRKFQTEFADEIHSVFADAARRGNRAVFAFCAGEARDLPMAILREQLRERSKMEARPNDAMRIENASWRAVLATTAPFLIIAVVSLLNMLQIGGTAAPDWLGYIFLGILTLPFVIGLLRSVPRWFLPYLGVFASFANIVLVLSSSRILYGSIRMSDPWIVRLNIQEGFSWIGLLVLTVSFVTITLILPPLRPVYARIRQDWTLLSFSLYGAMVPGLVLTFEDHPSVGRGFYEIACSFILAAGAWAYLYR